ncbi:MAG: hypothetical protein NC429_12105 [Lachnospiraceae bacterium]|nr:hypothetical protein [Lachnospiraceae bacterium]
MKKYKKFVKIISMSLFVLDIFLLTGCGEIGDAIEQTDTAVQYEILEVEPKSIEVQSDVGTTQIQDNVQEQGGEMGWTQEKIDEADRRDRAVLEEKVKAAGGISEDEAIEIARKAMEIDIGEKAKELEVRIYPDVASNGWKLRLYDITDWDEYKDKGDIAYSVQFGNKEEVTDPKEFCDYHCMVNAVDGSICGAYSLSGDVGLYWDYDDLVWYEH